MSTGAEERWLAEDLPELVGQAEALKILGVSKSTIIRWMRPGSGPRGDRMTYMCPWVETARGPVWPKADVERFAAQIGRQRSEPVPREKPDAAPAAE